MGTRLIRNIHNLYINISQKISIKGMKMRLLGIREIPNTTIQTS